MSALEHFIDNERISPDLALKVLAEVRCHLPACCLSLMPTGSCCVLSVLCCCLQFDKVRECKALFASRLSQRHA